MNSTELIVNTGICGAFIGAVVLSFSRERNLSDVFKDYHENLRGFASFFEVKKAVYIPECEALPKGGLFLALNEDFDLDIARLDPKTPILAGRSREAGLVLRPPGSEIVAREEKSFEAVASALKAMKLLKSAVLLRGEVEKISVEGVAVDFCSEDCKVLPCPICGSLLLALSIESDELLEVESFRIGEKIEITAKRIGGLERWM